MHLRNADLGGDLGLCQPVEEAQLDDPALPLVERAEPGLDEDAVLDLAEPSVGRPEHVLHGLVVGALVAERLREGPRRVRLGRLQRLDDLVLVRLGRLGELRDRRRAAELGGLGLDRAREADAELLHPARHVQRPRAIAEVPLDLADDRGDGVRRELDAPRRVEPLDREEEPDGADLDEVLLRLAPAGVARRQAPHERHVPVHELVPRLVVPRPIGLDQGDEVDVLAGRRHAGTLRYAAETTSSTETPSPSSRSPTSSTSRVRTRRTPGSSMPPGANGPIRTSRPDGVASASSLTVSAASSCMRRLSTASRRSSTRSIGSSNRDAMPPRTSLPTLR